MYRIIDKAKNKNNNFSEKKLNVKTANEVIDTKIHTIQLQIDMTQVTILIIGRTFNGEKYCQLN
jgi:hypothetical protein